MTDGHTNTATAPLSACHEVPEKTLPNQADLSWSPLSLCTAVFSFFLSSYYILLPFCPGFCLNCHLALLGPETHSLQACLSLCPSSHRVLSFSITLGIRLFLLILWPLSSKLLFACLPHGNLGEPSRRGSLRWTASAVLPVLDHSCWTHFLGEVDWCSTGCTASWCHRLCSISNLAFQARLRASHHRVLF